MKNIFQADPFPDPIHAGQEIENVAIMFGIFTIIIMMIVLMIYFYVKVRDIIPIIVLWLFSIEVGFNSMTNPFFPFTPNFQIFFMILQSVLFILSALDMYEKRKNKKMRL